MVAKLVDCVEKELYGILRVDGVSVEDVQNEIYKIKEKFNKDGFDHWMLGDLFKEFPETWTWKFEVDCICNTLEI